MSDARLALTAGCSSIKFSPYAVAKPDQALTVLLRGEIESFDEAPHFRVQDINGKLLVENQFEPRICVGLTTSGR
jgi:hypothetical protein